MKRYAILALGLLTALALAACGDDSGGGTMPTATQALNATEPPAEAGIDPADFQSTVDNAFFPLVPGSPTAVYEGQETDPDTGEVIELRVESTVLEETFIVAGVEVTVVEVLDYEDGQLVESTRDYYAQHVDGSVYYLGEHVEEYEDGEFVGNEGQWLAGEGANLPGVFMPADPQVGNEFEQERAPGIAEDRSTVVGAGLTVTVAAATFEDCIRTEDYDPIGDVTEFKHYCRGVGLVSEENDAGETLIELVSL